jgi:hypothetical protein
MSCAGGTKPLASQENQQRPELISKMEPICEPHSKKISVVLVTTDFSDESHKALRYGAALMRKHTDQLTFDTLPPVNTVDDAGDGTRKTASPKNGRKDDSL